MTSLNLKCSFLELSGSLGDKVKIYVFEFCPRLSRFASSVWPNQNRVEPWYHDIWSLEPVLKTLYLNQGSDWNGKTATYYSSFEVQVCIWKITFEHIRAKIIPKWPWVIYAIYEEALIDFPQEIWSGLLFVPSSSERLVRQKLDNLANYRRF